MENLLKTSQKICKGLLVSFFLFPVSSAPLFSITYPFETIEKSYPHSHGHHRYVGPRGHKGHRGVDGPQGVQGKQGKPGDQGAKGATGRQGDRGIQGDQGDQGNQGLQGNPGPLGPQGHEGDKGPTGPTGATGSTGDIGITGSPASLVLAAAQCESNGFEMPETIRYDSSPTGMDESLIHINDGVPSVSDHTPFFNNPAHFFEIPQGSSGDYLISYGLLAALSSLKHIPFSSWNGTFLATTESSFLKIRVTSFSSSITDYGAIPLTRCWNITNYTNDYPYPLTPPSELITATGEFSLHLNDGDKVSLVIDVQNVTDTDFFEHILYIDPGQTFFADGGTSTTAGNPTNNGAYLSLLRIRP